MSNGSSNSKWKSALELVVDKADAILVHNRYNVRYISGYTNDTGVLYISPKQRVLLTDFRYLFQAQNEAMGYEVIDVAGIGYAKAISELAKEDGIKRLGFEDNELSYMVYKKYAEVVNSELVPIGEILGKLRIVKTEEEIEHIAKAESIGDKAFSEIIKVIKPGMTELEIAARLEYIMKCEGAEGLSFDTIVASGINSSMPHATPSVKPIEIGDFVLLFYTLAVDAAGKNLVEVEALFLFCVPVVPEIVAVGHD